jgi:hypothetical protein
MFVGKLIYQELLTYKNIKKDKNRLKLHTELVLYGIHEMKITHDGRLLTFYPNFLPTKELTQHYAL